MRYASFVLMGLRAKRLSVLVLTALLICGLAPSARADLFNTEGGNLNGRWLDAFCSVAQQPSPAATMCISYLQGVNDATKVMPHYLGKKKRMHSAGAGVYCLPEGTSLDDMVAAIRAYMFNRPQVKEASASRVVVDAWQAAFPCEKSARLSSKN
jgi:hypothetical protein